MDNQNREAVVFGKGVGHVKPPSEISPDAVERIYYRSDSDFSTLKNEIDPSKTEQIHEAMSHIVQIIEQEMRVHLTPDSFAYIVMCLHVSNLINHAYAYRNQTAKAIIDDMNDQTVSPCVQNTLNQISEYLKNDCSVDDTELDRCFGLLLLTRLAKEYA